MNDYAVAFGDPNSHGCIFNVPQAGGFFTCSFVNFWVRFHTIITKNKPEKIGAEQEDIMAEQQFIMTQKGYDEAVERLKYLQTVKRQEIVERIAEARSHGDLSENAEYHSARDEKAQLDGEALEIEAILKNCEIAVKKDSDTIDVGTKFKYYDVDMEEEYVFTLVGTAEADYTKQKISTDSPVGLAVFGKKVGDEITVKTPKGEEYQIKITEILD